MQFKIPINTYVKEESAGKSILACTKYGKI